MRRIRLIEIPSELGADIRGSSIGIDAIKIAALENNSDLFTRLDSQSVKDLNKLLLTPYGSKHARYINGIHILYRRIAALVQKAIKDKRFPLVLSGDHSSAGAVISGIKIANPRKRLGVIWIDAHADIHSPYTTPSGKIHGMPMAIVLGEDNQDAAVNNVNGTTIKVWNKLKALGDIEPKIYYEDLVYIGLRALEKQEIKLLKKKQVTIIKVSEVRKKGAAIIAKQALKKLEHCDQIYITFDVDVLDPKVSTGTGTPVKNGLKEDEASGLLSGLAKNKKICCIEVTEVNPTLDTRNAMAKAAYRIIENTYKQIAGHR